MPVQSFWTLGTGSGGSLLSQEVFIIVFVAIIIGWIIIALWTRVLDNFTYNKLNMDKTSTWDTALIAIAVTVFFFTFVWMIDSYTLVKGSLEQQVAGEDDPFFNQIQQEVQSSALIGTSFTGPRNASVATLFPQVVFG